MKTRKLGNLEVSELGFGCMGMSHAAGAPMSVEEGAEVLRAAVDAGYTYFDTAKNYGNVNDPCHNEKILGRAFAGMRDKVIIGSKTGVEFDYAVDPDMPPLIYDSSRDSIRKSVEGSLKRLGTDYIDLYFQARIDPKVEPEEVAETMAELIKVSKEKGAIPMFTNQALKKLIVPLVVEQILVMLVSYAGEAAISGWARRCCAALC